MVDLIDRLKGRARALHRGATAQDACALEFLASALGPDAPSLAADVRRRHCLAAVAQSLGFRGWPHAKSVLSGEAERDRGTLMFRESSAMWKIWSASYDEARSIRDEHGGFLFPYRHQFFITDEHYLSLLNLDPEDRDWGLAGRDWIEPRDREAWTRLTDRAIASRLARAPFFSAA